MAENVPYPSLVPALGLKRFENYILALIDVFESNFAEPLQFRS